MKKPDEDINDQQWFNDNMKEKVNRFDAIHEPDVPDFQAFNRLVVLHKEDIKRKLWKELSLFWLTACFIFGSMMWILDRNWIWFIVLQAVIAVSGIGFGAMTLRKGMRHKWKS